MKKIKRFCYHCQRVTLINIVQKIGEYKNKEVWYALCSVCSKPFSITHIGTSIVLV